MTQVQEEAVFQQYNTEMTIHPLGKGQDHGLFGDHVQDGGEGRCEWLVGLDGHGSNIVIDFLRQKVDWPAIMKQPDSFSSVVDTIRASPMNTRLTGSTYAEAKIMVDQGLIHTCTVGDSELFVYKNGELVYRSCPHNKTNPDEMARLKQRIDSRLITVKDDPNIPVILSPTLLGAQAKAVFAYENGDRLNMTQSLGHNGVTGYAPCRHTIAFQPEDDVVVIIGSDGLTEMLLEDEIARLYTWSAKELADLAAARWQQEWTWKGWNKKDPELSTVTQFSDFDDVLAMKWTNKKVSDRVDSVRVDSL